MREFLGDGLHDLFADEIARLEGDGSAVEKRAAEILAGVRDRLVGQPRLTQDRHR